MTTDPQISVVINNYNYGRFLSQAIDSALSQVDVRSEVIVVDDGSTDELADIIQEYGSRVFSVFQKNGGQARAINAGVSKARAPLIAFLDADDWWREEKLRRVIDAHARAPQAGLIYHRLQPTNLDGTLAFSPIPRSLCAGDLAPRLLRSGGRWPFPMTSSLTVTKSAWDEVGDIPADFRISADAWICGVLPFLFPVVALPEALGSYRIHQNAWYRAQDDRDMLARRLAHWEQTVAVTNRALAMRRAAGQIQLRDHFHHRVVATRLGVGQRPGTLPLLWHGLTDAGEPNPLRRLRDTLAALAAIRHDHAVLREGARRS